MIVWEEESRPGLHRQVTGGVLDRVPHLVGRRTAAPRRGVRQGGDFGEAGDDFGGDFPPVNFREIKRRQRLRTTPPPIAR